MNTLDILERLVAFPTISDQTNLPLIHFARSHLEDCGFSCRLVPDATGAKASLFASIGPEGPDGIVLSAHSDVVPVDGQAWSSDPFRLTARDGRLFGRGSADMKGFLACMLGAAEQARGRSLRRPLHLAISYDEEIGCVGVRGLLAALKASGFRAAACIVGEPTRLQAVTGHKGKIAARATFHGVGGHSALAPDFLNAIHLACDFVASLRALQARIAQDGARDDGYGVPYTTVHAGRLNGGTALNVVASQAHVDFEIRHLAADDPDALMGEIGDLAQAVVAPHRARFPAAGAVIEVLNRYPGLDAAPDDAAVRLVAPLAPEPGFAKVSFGTEAGLFAAELGLPSVVIGPGSMAQGHQPDEFIAVSEIERCEAMLSRLLA